MELKTPLYDCHVAAGGKIVPFAMAVRTACGLFDVSHMGEFLIKGADALANVQNLFCNDFTNMYDGQVRYSPMLNGQGGRRQPPQGRRMGTAQPDRQRCF